MISDYSLHLSPDIIYQVTFFIGINDMAWRPFVPSSAAALNDLGLGEKGLKSESSGIR